jgi:hypothetical protein
MIVRTKTFVGRVDRASVVGFLVLPKGRIRSIDHSVRDPAAWKTGTCVPGRKRAKVRNTPLSEFGQGRR